MPSGPVAAHIWGKNEDDRHYPNLYNHQEGKNQIEKEPRVSEAPSLLLEAAETDNELSGEKDTEEVFHHLKYWFGVVK